MRFDKLSISVSLRSVQAVPAMGICVSVKKQSFWVAIVGIALLVITVLNLSYPRATTLLGNTLLLAFGTAAGSLLLGSFLAFLLFRTDLPGSYAWVLLLIFPIFIPLPIFAGLWKSTLGIQGLLANFTGTVFSVGMIPAMATHTIASLPWVILIVGLGFLTVEAELEETALLETSPLHVIWIVSVRRAWGSIVSAGLLVATLTTTEISLTDLFQVRTYAEEVYTFYASQGALPPLPLWNIPGHLLLASGMIAVLIGTFNIPPDRWTRMWRCHLFALRRWKWPAVVFLTLTTLGILGTLLCILIFRVGLSSERKTISTPTVTSTLHPSTDQTLESNNSQWPQRPPTVQYIRKWSIHTAVSSIWRCFVSRQNTWWLSLTCGVTASLLTVGLLLPIIWLARDQKWVSVILSLLIGGLLATPGPMMALALIHFFNQGGALGYIYNSTGILILGLGLRIAPVVCLCLWIPLQMIPANIIEAGKTDVADRLQMIRYIYLPLSLIPASIALLGGTALSMGELSVTVLLHPPGLTPLSVDIFSSLHSGLYNQVAATTLLMLGFLFCTGLILAIRMRTLKQPFSA